MKKTKPLRAGSPGARRNGSRPLSRRLRDGILLPLALILVVFEIGLQAWSRLLRRFEPIRRLEALLGRLPPWAILPLFLIPEAMSHVGGFYAAYLFTHRRLVEATLVAILVKGVGFLIALWIYQACRPALMMIRWFAWAHGKVEAARAWAMDRMRHPLVQLRSAMRRVRSMLMLRRMEPGAPHSVRRFAAIRQRLLNRLSGRG